MMTSFGFVVSPADGTLKMESRNLVPKKFRFQAWVKAGRTRGSHPGGHFGKKKTFENGVPDRGVYLYH